MERRYRLITELFAIRALPVGFYLAFQRPIDRIAFLRICEDRGVEAMATCKCFAQGPITIAVYSITFISRTSATIQVCSTSGAKSIEQSRPTWPANH
jgi:hypothetical protein